MIKSTNTNIFYAFLLIALFSCGDADEYRVDPTFAGYLQRFKAEAIARGKNIAPERDGLVIEFADLKDGKAGLTHYENPVRIEIDKKYWDAIGAYAGADLMKEDLIFHELGHGLLNRDHLNSVLPNGDWKSIMCGGNKVDNRPWNINYRGIRRDYYIDELFNESTSSPGFAKKQLGIDTTGFPPAVYFSFDAENEAGWPLVADGQRQISIDNGRLKFKSLIQETYLVLAYTPVDVQSDFSYELTIELPVENLTDKCGLVFGYLSKGSDGTRAPLEYFSVGNNRRMVMGNRSWYSFYTELDLPYIIPGGRNKLKVFKTSNMLYYFVNDIYSYCSEMETKEPGNVFGFTVPPMAEILVDNFVVSRKGLAKSAMGKVKSQPLEFEIIKSEFETNKIKPNN